MRLAALFSSLLALTVSRPAFADEPVTPPPAEEPITPPPPTTTTPPEMPPPPVASPSPAAPALPEGVTPIHDMRPVTFVLTGGNRIVARRVGEDAEFFWVESGGRMARIRKSDIASVEFRTDLPPATSPAQQQPLVDNEGWSRVPVSSPTPRGRGMVIWGSIMFGLGYTAAIAGTLSNETADDGTALLLALPLAGPFLYAATGADREEVGPWIIDGLLQAGGVVLLYFGISRMRETPERPRRRRSQLPSLDVSLGPHGGFAQATWAL